MSCGKRNKDGGDKCRCTILEGFVDLLVFSVDRGVDALVVEADGFR